MSYGPTRLPTLIGAFLAAVLLGGCDDISYRTGERSAQPPVFQPQSMRSLVNGKGLQTLYRVEYAQGALVDYPREKATGLQFELDVGPVSHRVSVDRWEVRAHAEQLEVDLEIRDVELAVPVRMAERVGARICRLMVEDDGVSVQSDAQVGEVDQVPQLVAAGTPDVVWSNPQVSLIGDCPPLESLDEQEGALLDSLMIDYLTRAFEASAREIVAMSPLEGLGLVHSPVGLSRVSNFENRRGRLLVSARVDTQAQLSADGLGVDLDMAMNNERASCAPAYVAEAPVTRPADPVPAAELERVGAEVGLTLAAPALLRLAQTATLAGFGCRGLEDLSLDGGASNIATDNLNLDAVGLGELPIGAWTEPVLTPGSLPALALNASNSTIDVSWEDLSIDFYARIQGVPVRILQLNAGLDASFRPVNRLGHIKLAADSAVVADATLNSQFLADQSTDADLEAWASRLMLLVLEDALSLPLPMEPGAPLQLVDSQVRHNDVLLLFELDRHVTSFQSF